MDVLVAVALSSVVVAYNAVANRWSAFHGWFYVPLNLAFAGAVVAATSIRADLSATQLGLSVEVTDFFLPLALVALFATFAFALALSPLGRLIADERVRGMYGGTLAAYVLVRIPLGTAVVEEVVFRGVLFALWRDTGASAVPAALFSSIAFGLWHIQPTLVGLKMNEPLASRNKVRAAVIGAVFLTTVAGLGLVFLRTWSGGLLAPIVLHAGINSVGALAAVTAGRRKRDSQGAGGGHEPVTVSSPGTL